MKTKILVILVLLLFTAYGWQTESANNPPTAPQNAPDNNQRTVVARPEATQAPSDNTNKPTIVKTNAASEKTPNAVTEPDNTTMPSATQDTSATPAVEPTALPTADISRPLLPTAAPTGSIEQSAKPQEYAIGTPIRLGKATVTINGMEHSGPREGEIPRAGNEYLILAALLENNNTRVITFDASQFSLQAKDGTIIPYEDVTFQDNLLRTLDLEPNAKKDVFLVFQIPAGSKGYKLVLGDPATGGLATVKLD